MGSIKLTVEDKKGGENNISVQQVLVAVGRGPLIEGLGLERLQIETERGSIKVDRQYQTNCKGVYAVGDVTGAPLLAHAAAAEGVAAVEMMVGTGREKSGAERYSCLRVLSTRGGQCRPERKGGQGGRP